MRWLAVLVVAAAGLAAAQPDLKNLDPAAADWPTVETCTKGKAWKLVTKCMKKEGHLIEIWHNDHAHLVAHASWGKHADDFVGSLYLYVKTKAGWRRTNFEGPAGASWFKTTKLLATEPFVTPNGTGLRIDVGDKRPEKVYLHNRFVDAVHRTTMTTVCLPPTWSCTKVLSDCEVQADGGSAWWFTGDVFWHATLGIRVRGDTRTMGGPCQPAKELLHNEDP